MRVEPITDDMQAGARALAVAIGLLCTLIFWAGVQGGEWTGEGLATQAAQRASLHQARALAAASARGETTPALAARLLTAPLPAERAGIVALDGVDDLGIARGSELVVDQRAEGSAVGGDAALLSAVASLESEVERSGLGESLSSTRLIAPRPAGGHWALFPVVDAAGELTQVAFVSSSRGAASAQGGSWGGWLGIALGLLMAFFVGRCAHIPWCKGWGRAPWLQLFVVSVVSSIAFAGLVASASQDSLNASLAASLEELVGHVGYQAALLERAAPGVPLVFDNSVLIGFLLALTLIAYGLHGWLGAVLSGLRRAPGVYGYAGPALIATLVLVFVPFVTGVGLAFFDAGPGGMESYRYLGLGNFIEILFPDETADTHFYFTLGVTVVWTALNVALHVAIGLGLALLLNRPGLRFRGIYRVLLILPWAVPSYITALIWKGMFNSEYGAVNHLLLSLGFLPVEWFGQSFLTNFTANLVTNTWLGFPFMMVVCLGALQSIPGELYEAAELDGASRWQQFRSITLPLLRPALLPAVLLGIIWTFNMFNVIYLVSGGGPDNQTNILITEAFYQFKVLGRYGFAAAYSVLIFGVLLAYTAVTTRITRATEGAFE